MANINKLQACGVSLAMILSYFFLLFDSALSAASPTTELHLSYVVADDAAVADPEVAAVADTAAVAVTTRKRKKTAKKHATNDGVDDFVIERQAISPLRPQQLARAAGGGVYVPPSWLRL